MHPHIAPGFLAVPNFVVGRNHVPSDGQKRDGAQNQTKYDGDVIGVAFQQSDVIALGRRLGGLVVVGNAAWTCVPNANIAMATPCLKARALCKP